MSRVNHSCGGCGHRAEVHLDPADPRSSLHVSGYTRCTCCRTGTFDTSGAIQVVPTYTPTGAIEDRHYSPGDRRVIGGPPHRTHTCDGCVALDDMERSPR